MTTGVLATPPILSFTYNNGQLAAGGSILTQVGGVNAATYQDVGLTTALPNPIPLNSRGEISNAQGASCQLFLTPNTVYVFTLFDSKGNQIWIATYINGVQFTLTRSAIGALLYPQTAAEAAASITPTDLAYPVGNIKRYGAISDWNWGSAAGSASGANASAINSAIKALQYSGGGILYVPAGAYSVSSALNFANSGAFPYNNGNCSIIIQGEGMGIAFTPGGSPPPYGGSWIVGLTNNWIVDCTGAQYLSFKDIGFRGTTGSGGSGKAQGGVLLARSTNVQFAQQNRFEHCTIWVDTSPAYTSVGSIGIGNNGAESFVMDHCWVIADTPLALTFSNDLGYTSPYTTIETTLLSSTNMSFRDTTFQAITNYACYLQGVQDIKFQNCVYGQFGANTTNYAIRLLASGGSHCQDIQITGQIENAQIGGTGPYFPGGTVRFDDATTWNINVDMYLPNPNAPYISTGTVAMYGNSFNIQHSLNTGNYVISAAAGTQMIGGNIYTYANDTGLTPNTNLAVNGVEIRGQNVDVSGALGFATGSTYIAIGNQGTTIQQPLGLAVVPNAGNNSNAAASPSAPTSYLKPDGRIQLAGTFTPTASTTMVAGTAIGTIATAHRPNRTILVAIGIPGGTVTTAQLLTNGQIILGANIVASSSQTAPLDGIEFNLNN